MAFASASAPRRRRVFDHGEESEKTKSAFVTKPREEDDDEEDEEYEEEMMRASDEKEDDGEEDHASCLMTSTVLLEKNRELDAIAMKLQRTIYECEKTTKRLDEREGILLQAQESLHRDCAKFENFARDPETYCNHKPNR